MLICKTSGLTCSEVGIKGTKIYLSKAFKLQYKIGITQTLHHARITWEASNDGNSRRKKKATGNTVPCRWWELVSYSTICFHTEAMQRGESNECRQHLPFLASYSGFACCIYGFFGCRVRRWTTPFWSFANDHSVAFLLSTASKTRRR